MALQMHPIAIGCILVVAVGTLIYNYVTTTRQQQHPPHGYGGRTSDWQNAYEFSPPSATSSVKSEQSRSSTRKRRSSDDNCSICLGRLKTSLKMLTCKHVFHDHCISIWLIENKSCPICRKNVTL